MVIFVFLYVDVTSHWVPGLLMPFNRSRWCVFRIWTTCDTPCLPAQSLYTCAVYFIIATPPWSHPGDQTHLHAGFSPALFEIVVIFSLDHCNTLIAGLQNPEGWKHHFLNLTKFNPAIPQYAILVHMYKAAMESGLDRPPSCPSSLFTFYYFQTLRCPFPVLTRSSLNMTSTTDSCLPNWETTFQLQTGQKIHSSPSVRENQSSISYHWIYSPPFHSLGSSLSKKISLKILSFSSFSPWLSFQGTDIVLYIPGSCDNSRHNVKS